MGWQCARGAEESWEQAPEERDVVPGRGRGGDAEHHALAAAGSGQDAPAAENAQDRRFKVVLSRILGEDGVKGPSWSLQWLDTDTCTRRSIFWSLSFDVQPHADIYEREYAQWNSASCW